MGLTTRGRAPGLAIAVCAGATAASAAAVLASQAQRPTFRAATDLVHLDVSVLDRDRRPVRGLKVTDFTILEDGEPREISAFAALEAPPPMTPSGGAAWLTSASTDVVTNEIAQTPEGRLFVLILDDGLTPAEPAAIASAKSIAQAAIARLGAGDRMAVVFTVGSLGAQTFTSDRQKLLAAVGTFTPGYAKHVMGWENAEYDSSTEPPRWRVRFDNDTRFREGSLRTLNGVADALIAAPQRRKAIIFVSPGVFADQDGANAITMAQPGRLVGTRQANSSLVASLPSLYRRMREANVTIYPVDPMGFGGLEAYVLRTAGGLPAMGAAKVPLSNMADWYDPPDPPLPIDLASKVARVNLDFMRAAAENTGGFATVDTNDLAGGMDRMFDENAAYYLLGFALPSGRDPGSRHRLEVRVARADVTVRTRTGYQVAEPPAVRPGDDAAALLSGPVPVGVLPLRVALAAFASPDGGDAVVAVALGMTAAGADVSGQDFDVVLRAFSPDGTPKFGERRTGRSVLKPQAARMDPTFDLLMPLRLGSGRYELRFGAALEPKHVAGSLYADLEVPDFTGSRISLSGVVIDGGGSTSAGPLDAFSGVIPVVPTSRREFGRTESVKAFVRAYQGGTAPIGTASLLVRLRDSRDAVVFNNRYALAAARFSELRSADFTFDLPMRAMGAGEHLLEFEARLGSEIATRQVRVRIR